MAGIRRLLSLIILVILTTTQTGCRLAFSGRTEMNRIEFIRAIGLDKCPEREGFVRLTIATQTIQSGGGGGGQQKQSEILISDGSTVFEAVRNFWNFMDKRPFWGHLEYIVIGEEAAEDGILKYIDYFCRNSEVRLNLKVYVARGLRAGDVIRKGSSSDKFVFDRLEGVNQNRWGQSVSNVVDLMEIMYILDNKNLSLYIPCIELEKLTKSMQEPEETMDIVLGGFAIFTGDKLRGHLNEKMGRGLNWLRNKIKSGVIIVKSPGGSTVSLEIIDSKSKLKPKITEGELTITVDVEMSSNISEIRASENIFKTEILDYLVNEQEKIIREEIENVIKYAQEREMDFFGAANAVYHKYPIKWEDLYEKNWSKAFPKIKFNVAVRSKINRTYDIKQPSRSEVDGEK